MMTGMVCPDVADGLVIGNVDVVEGPANNGDSVTTGGLLALLEAG